MMTKQQWNNLVRDIPASGGLYCIWRDSEVLYIGTSANLHRRLGTSSHHKLKSFLQLATAITFICTNTNKRTRFAMEFWLIEKHKPLLYRKSGKPRRAHPTQLPK